MSPQGLHVAPGLLKLLNKHNSSPPESINQHQAGIKVICTSVIRLRQGSVNALSCGSLLVLAFFKIKWIFHVRE